MNFRNETCRASVSLPSLLRCYPRSFTFYLGNPFETRSVPTSLVATLAILPSISEIPFLDSSIPGFLIEFSGCKATALQHLAE